MITFINQFIGITPFTPEVQYVIGAMFTIWLIYLFMQLIYNILGINK